MRAKQLGKGQNSRKLQALIRPLRELDNHTNLKYLALEYATLIAIVAPTLAFLYWREAWGLSWAWNLPVVATAIVLVGAVQHRLAGLGHEASHYVLFRNRFWNELVSDVFCMFPLYATTHQYRLVHMAHHQYTNDWERDPDLLNIGASKLMDRFPMTRWQFIYQFYIRFFMPHVLLRYLWDIVYLSVFGRGISPYLERDGKDAENQVNLNFRWTSVAGFAYFFFLVGALAWINHEGGGPALGWFPAAALTAVLAGLWVLPERAFFQSPLKETYSIKVTNSLRLAYYTAFLTLFAWLRAWTGENWGKYYLLLWVVPMMTSFAYFMLLRDVYQHANADDGKLTNTRVFFNDPFTTWAVWVYGMDMHVPHHLYPAVPHYRLKELHHVLKSHNEEYAQHVVECHGTFANRQGLPTILDVMESPTTETAPLNLAHPGTFKTGAVRSRQSA